MKLKEVEDGQTFSIGQVEYVRRYQYKRSPIVTCAQGDTLVELPEDTEVSTEATKDYGDPKDWKWVNKEEGEEHE